MPEESKLAEKLENQTKFSEEEMKTIKEIQDEYIKVQTQFGQLSISRIRLHNQLNSLDDSETELNKSFANLQEKERKFLEETSEKYGQGTLNPETGEFTPNKSE